MTPKIMRHQAWFVSVSAERPPEEAPLRESGPHGRHGHQQCQSRGYKDSCVIQADTFQGNFRSSAVKITFFPVCSSNEEAIGYDSE